MNVKKKGQYCILNLNNDSSLLQVSGRIRETLNILHDAGHKKICVDLTKAPIIDSSVIGTLVSYHEVLKNQGGELIIINSPNPALEALFRMQLHKVLRIINSEDELD